MVQIKVLRLVCPEHSGDWHDKPLKWKVAGPGDEVQKFLTRKDADQYARLRRKMSQQKAHAAYSEAATTFILL